VPLKKEIEKEEKKQKKEKKSSVHTSGTIRWHRSNHFDASGPMSKKYYLTIGFQ